MSIFSPKSFAYNGPICDTIFKSSNVGCNDQAASNSSGGSYPLLFDAFNFNPSALPTFPTPVGIEAYLNNNKVNFAFIKGIENVGFGASSKNSNTTFFSGAENYKVALSNSSSSYKSTSLDQYINVGTALNLLKIPSIGSLPLGLSYRYNPETKKWTFNPGFEIRTSIFSLGLSYNRETPDKYNDGFYTLQEERENISMNAGLKFTNLLLGYSLIYQRDSTRYFMPQSTILSSSTIHTVGTHIFSSTLITSNMSFTAAYRKQNDSLLQSAYVGTAYKTSHTLIGASYKSEHFELGAFYNYVLNNDISMLVKIFF